MTAFFKQTWIWQFHRRVSFVNVDEVIRMVVDSRYQLVAKGKKRLSVLFIVEALLLLVGMVFAFLPGTKDDTPNKVHFYSVIGSVVLLIIADIGRGRSRPSFLTLYDVLSSLLMLLLTASLANQRSLLKDLIKSKETALETSASSILENERELQSKIDELEEKVEEFNESIALQKVVEDKCITTSNDRSGELQ